MPDPTRFSINDLRQAARDGSKHAMLTCYDYSTARLLEETGVRLLLVGDSAANVILGHETTVPVTLDFLITLTAAVRRGAPRSMVIGDMPFGSVAGGFARATRNVLRMFQQGGCDAVKIEATPRDTRLVSSLTDAGVPVIVHLGLRPQAAGVSGGFGPVGRDADAALKLVETARRLAGCGAVAVLLEAVPPEVSQAVVDLVQVPVIGCGAGPAPCAHVVVLQDLLGITPRSPRFVPRVGHVDQAIRDAAAEYLRQVTAGEYPAVSHQYVMPEDQAQRLRSVLAAGQKADL